ncbi:uncharacterized protein [Amphiura filiformis]|uniref:uncharacterized protein n=1 Tax=Amphiura filiformis TaxID=82378 RepID=UPI003B2177B5
MQTIVSMDRSRQEIAQNTENGRAVLQCTSYPNNQTSMFDWNPVYPQLENNIIREDEGRQADIPIQRMLHDDDDQALADDVSNYDQASFSNHDQAFVSNHDQASVSNHDQASASGTGTSSGISMPTNTSTTNSIDDLSSYMRKVTLRSPSTTTASSDEAEDPFERRKVPEMGLRELSSKLGVEWEKLATFLGFSFVDIQRFKCNQPQNMENQIFLMLMTWRCWLSNRATSHKLARALEKSGRTDLADEILHVDLQTLENRPPAKQVPNQMFNNLLMSLTELTEGDRRKIALLIRQDNLTGDGAILTGQDGKPPELLKLIECLEVNNYLDANNVWYLQYLLRQLRKKDLYDQVWRYAVRRFKKHETLYLHEPSSVKGTHYSDIQFKVIGKVEHFGGMHLEEFRGMLAAKFDGEVRHISSIGAQIGCIELIFQVPSSYKKTLMKAAQDNATWLLDLNVMSVEVKGEALITLQTETDDDQTAELSKEMLLFQAIIDHDKQEVEQLLTDGACPNYKVGGKWLLQWAVFMDQEEDKEEFVQLLLDHGADRDAKDEMDMTAVEEAAFLGRCRKTLTFTLTKPAHSYLKKEAESITFIPQLTAENLQLYSVFSLEKKTVCVFALQKGMARDGMGLQTIFKLQTVSHSVLPHVKS